MQYPQFENTIDPRMAKGGYARSQVWSVVSRLDSVTHTTHTPRSRVTDSYINHLHTDWRKNTMAHVVLEYEQTKPILEFKYPYVLTLRVDLSLTSLKYQFSVRNTSDRDAFRFTTSLGPYFSTGGGIDHVCIRGLKGLSYIDRLDNNTQRIQNETNKKKRSNTFLTGEHVEGDDDDDDDDEEEEEEKEDERISYSDTSDSDTSDSDEEIVDGVKKIIDPELVYISREVETFEKARDPKLIPISRPETLEERNAKRNRLITYLEDQLDIPTWIEGSIRDEKEREKVTHRLMELYQERETGILMQEPYDLLKPGSYYIDRLYTTTHSPLHDHLILTRNDGHILEITKSSNLKKWWIYNPWEEGCKGKRNKEFDDDGYNHMLCVHPVIDDPMEILLNEGETWTSYIHIDIVSNVTTHHSLPSKSKDTQRHMTKVTTNVVEYSESELGALFDVFDTLKRMFFTKDQYHRAIHYIGIEHPVFSPFAPEQKQMNKEQFIKAAMTEINQSLLKVKINSGMNMNANSRYSDGISSQQQQQRYEHFTALNNDDASILNDNGSKK